MHGGASPSLTQSTLARLPLIDVLVGFGHCSGAVRWRIERPRGRFWQYGAPVYATAVSSRTRRPGGHGLAGARASARSLSIVDWLLLPPAGTPPYHLTTSPFHCTSTWRVCCPACICICVCAYAQFSTTANPLAMEISGRFVCDPLHGPYRRVFGRSLLSRMIDVHDINVTCIRVSYMQRERPHIYHLDYLVC